MRENGEDAESQQAEKYDNKTVQNQLLSYRHHVWAKGYLILIVHQGDLPQDCI
jgi:hypothetical protein